MDMNPHLYEKIVTLRMPPKNSERTQRWARIEEVARRNSISLEKQTTRVAELGLALPAHVDTSTSRRTGSNV